MATSAGALTPKAPTPLKQFSTEEISNEILLEKLNLRVEAVVIGCERGTLWWALGYPRHTVTLYNQSENQPNHSLDSGNKTPTHPQTHYLDLFITELERRVALFNVDEEDKRPPAQNLEQAEQMARSFECIEGLKVMDSLLINAMIATQNKGLKPFAKRMDTMRSKVFQLSYIINKSVRSFCRDCIKKPSNGSFITFLPNQAAPATPDIVQPSTPPPIARDPTSNRGASDSKAVSPLTQQERQEFIASIAATPMSDPAAVVKIDFQRKGWLLTGEYILVATENDQVLNQNLNQTVAALIEDLKRITEDPQIADESRCVCVNTALLVLKAYDAYYKQRHTGRFVGTAHTIGVAFGTAPSLSDIIYPLALALDPLLKKLSVQAAAIHPVAPANTSDRQPITSFRPDEDASDTPPAPASETQPSDDL